MRFERIGGYRVTAKIGEGGMGEVYRARDTKLDRDVALKVLPQAFTDDPDRLARFEREAKVLASLNHPNIGHIYGLEEAEGQKALVLELVEGPTLAERIKQGPIPVDEALPIAKQIAEALEAAHEQGIIHRDLKPANVKVKDDGTVKVLDFGLAKAFQPDASSVSASMSPTISLTAAATQMGMVLGTAAYMAPEQAKGKVVDKRADVWAFGAVLYEMLVGQKPFTGKDVSDTLAAVLRIDANLDALPAETPARLRQVLRACLQKERKDRVRDIGDVSLAMDGAFDSPAVETSSYVKPAQLRIWQRPVPLVLGGVALVATVAGLVAGVVPGTQATQVVRFSMSERPNMAVVGTAQMVAISRDGTRIVYTGPGGQFYLRSLDQRTPELLEGGAGFNPFISPDGNWVGFRGEEDNLYRVSIFGGPPQTISDGIGGIQGASWGTDDTIIFGTLQQGTGLFRVSANGGEPEQLTTLQEGETAHRWPEILPGDKAVMFTVHRGDGSTNSEIVVLNLETNVRTRLIPGGSSPHYSTTGHIVYGGQGTLRAVPFDLDELLVTGDPIPVLDGVVTAARGEAQFSIAENGTLVYLEGAFGGGGGSEQTLVWVDRDGREETLTDLVAADYRSVDLSPDGSALALELASDLGSDIWTFDLARGTLNPVSTDLAPDGNPLWTPDGRQVVFSSLRDGASGLYRRNADGTGDVEPLITSDDARLLANSWASAGERLVVERRTNRQTDLTLLSMDGEPTLEPLLDSEFNETRAAVSPDGDWIAYVSDRTGTNEIWVERFPDLGDRLRISTAGGYQPRWSPDGRELFYLGSSVDLFSFEAPYLMLVPVTTETGFAAGTPEIMVEGDFYRFRSRSSYDVAPDGQRFVMIKRGGDASDDASPQITVVLNWDQELLERVPIP